jgi:hypothetical protein
VAKTSHKRPKISLRELLRVKQAKLDYSLYLLRKINLAKLAESENL